MVEVVTSYFVHTRDTADHEEEVVEDVGGKHYTAANLQNRPLQHHLSTFDNHNFRHPRRYSDRIKVKMRNMERYQYRLFNSSTTFQFGPLERLWVLVFVDMLAVGLVIPLLPYYASNLGADAVTYGYLGSIYGISQLIGSPLMGSLSDRYGRVNTLIVSFLASVVSYAMMGMAGSLAMLFLSRIPVGVLKQTMSISYAYVSDVTDSTSRAKYLGFLGVAVGVGFIIGPALGGVLSEVSYTLPALVASAMFVFDSVFAYLFLPDGSTIMLDEEKERESGDEGLEGEIDVEKAKESQSEDEVVLPAQAKARQQWDIRAYLNWVLCVFKDTSVLFLIATSFAATLAFTTYRVTFPMISQVRFDLDARANGFLLSYMGLLSVFVQGSAVGYLTKRFSEGRLVQLASFGLGVSLCACALAFNLPMLAVALIPLVVCNGVLSTCILSTVTKKVPKADLGGVIGLLGSVQSLCSAVSPSLGGLLLKHGGAEGPGLYSGLCLMLIFFCMFARNYSVGSGERELPVFKHHLSDKGECTYAPGDWPRKGAEGEVKDC